MDRVAEIKKRREQISPAEILAAMDAAQKAEQGWRQENNMVESYPRTYEALNLFAIATVVSSRLMDNKSVGNAQLAAGHRYVEALQVEGVDEDAARNMMIDNILTAIAASGKETGRS